MTDTQITPASPRTTAQLKFSDGQVLEGPLDTTIEAFVRAGHFPPDFQPMACLVEGQLRELTYQVTRDLNVHLLTAIDSDGMRVYRRSLAFLLIAAAAELFPQARIIMEYGLNFGALYFEVEGRPRFTGAELKQIEAKMAGYVAADLPIVKKRIPLDEAHALLTAQQAEDKLRLLKFRRKPYLTIYTLSHYQGYMHGYMVPSAGYLKTFALEAYGDGAVLRYPRTGESNQLQPAVDYPQLVRVFTEYGDWMTKLGIKDVGALNEAVVNDRLFETILVAEALQEQRIAQITTLLHRVRDEVRLVLISGPSSSGKTTFSKRLAIQLLAHGVQPFALGLDDFIVNRVDNPRDEEGDYDYEHINSLNLDLFNQVLLGLIQGQAVTLPKYNFITGQREWGETVSISPEHMVIVEGIHGMNPNWCRKSRRSGFSAFTSRR
jgi:uridine kinase